MIDLRTRVYELGPVRLMRLGMLGLAIGAVIVTAAELAFLTHWDGTLQLLPWVALMAVSMGILLVVARPGRAAVWTARGLGAVALVLGGVGVLVHVISNHDAGILDYHYTDTWPTMGEVGRWWLAATGGVGPTPPLAPASLAFAALLLLMATIGILAPARAARSAPVTET
jgi:hypothetical protein